MALLLLNHEPFPWASFSSVQMSQDPRPVGRGEQVPPTLEDCVGWAGLRPPSLSGVLPLPCTQPQDRTAAAPGAPVGSRSGFNHRCQRCPSRHTHQLPAHPTPETHRAPNPARTPSTRTHAGSHLRPAEAPAPLDSAHTAPAATSPSGMWPELPDAHVTSHTDACWGL